MYGAILGDIIGSPYEFDRSPKKKEFPLFIQRCRFTDDSTMTIAVAEALLDTLGKGSDERRKAVVSSMRKWGRKYPNAGYGGRFDNWLFEPNPLPYYNWGNGSAMRVSSAGWLFDTLEETRQAAKDTAVVTHNHPEGLKGAEATASVIWAARNGWDKARIRKYVEKEFYPRRQTCDQIRPTYHFDVSCQGTVPQAITAFLEGMDFEDVIRTAVSLGGDCDTLTCIAGGMAEAMYGVPEKLKETCRMLLEPDMVKVLDRFEKAIKHGIGIASDMLGDKEREIVFRLSERGITQDNWLDHLEEMSDEEITPMLNREVKGRREHLEEELKARPDLTDRMRAEAMKYWGA